MTAEKPMIRKPTIRKPTIQEVRMPARHMRAGLAALTLAALLLPLGGCTGLEALGTVTQPVQLYEVSPKSTYDATLPQVTAQLVVEEPTAASSVNTDRIAVKPNAYQVQYFPEARWVDRAPLMVQTRLVESFENTGKVASVGRQAIGLSSDFTLVSELREFQAEAPGAEDGPLHAHVQLNMKIVREPQGLIIASQSFSREAKAASLDMLDVVRAFDTALGAAMRDAVEWTVQRIAEYTGGGEPADGPPSAGL
jgi:cholesterol transport system auxiliary component